VKKKESFKQHNKFQKKKEKYIAKLTRWNLIHEHEMMMIMKYYLPESPPDIKAHCIEPKESCKKKEMHKMRNENACESTNTVAC
jgi:hypothetical protein